MERMGDEKTMMRRKTERNRVTHDAADSPFASAPDLISTLCSPAQLGPGLTFVRRVPT